MFDFTLSSYLSLLEALSKQGFYFQPFSDYIETPKTKSIILRHDVDLLPVNSLTLARMERKMNIKGSYYCRIVEKSFKIGIISEIYELGHEIGYHYEDINLVAEKQKTKVKKHRWESIDDYEKYLTRIAIDSFMANLEKLRKIMPIKTICMHGSPMSKWDSRLLWKYYNYSDFGIIGEPYFDINFDKVLYLTDTGRRWDGDIVSIRDKGLGIKDKRLGEEGYMEWKVIPISGSLMNMTSESFDFQNKYKFRSTSEIISASKRGELPDKIMMTIHPQRWTDKSLPWVKELVWQNVKNVGKYFIVKIRD